MFGFAEGRGEAANKSFRRSDWSEKVKTLEEHILCRLGPKKGGLLGVCVKNE